MKIKSIKVAFLVTILVLSLFSYSGSVFAKNDNGNYKNKNGVVFSSQDLQRFKEIGYIQAYIDNMTQKQYDERKNFHSLNKTIKTEYLKTVYIYEKNENSSKKQKERKIKDVKVYKLSKEQFDKEVKEEKIKRQKVTTEDITLATSDDIYYGPVDPGGDDGTDPLPTYDKGTNSSSSYKTLTMEITKLSSSRFFLKTTMNWKIIPITREKDIISIGWDNSNNDWARVNSSIYGSQNYWAMSSGGQYTDSGTFYYTLSDDMNHFDLSTSGVGLWQNLKNDWDVYNVKTLKNVLQFEITKDSGNNTKYLNADGGYMHMVQPGATISVDSFSVSYPGQIQITFANQDDEDKYDILYRAYSQLQLY